MTRARIATAVLAALAALAAPTPSLAQHSGGGDKGKAAHQKHAAPKPAKGKGETQKPAAGGKADAAPPSKSDMAYGAFQRGYYLTARQLAEPLANLGDPAAQVLLGEIYLRGLGVARNAKEAAKWYKAAAETGNATGQFHYALLLLGGSGGVEKDVAKARDLMKAAADAGDPMAEFNYGEMLIQASPAGGFKEAKAYFEKSAEAGIPDAQYALSQLYAYGRGVDKDLAKARQWLGSAAAKGYAAAQIEFGIWLINGKGGPAEAKEGFQWLKRAGERGNPIAMNRLAHLYKDGIGVAADKVEAAKWSVLAKRADNTDPVLDDFFRGLDEAAQKAGLEAANRFHGG